MLDMKLQEESMQFFFRFLFRFLFFKKQDAILNLLQLAIDVVCRLKGMPLLS